MGFAMFAAAVNAGTIQHHIDRQFAPRKRLEGRLMQKTDGIIANKQLLSPGVHRAKAPMAGVIFQ
jgi:hypothetical protein